MIYSLTQITSSVRCSYPLVMISKSVIPMEACHLDHIRQSSFDFRLKFAVLLNLVTLNAESLSRAYVILFKPIMNSGIHHFLSKTFNLL